MKQSSPLFQIIKGWLFIAVAAASLYLIAKVMEKMHQDAGIHASTIPVSRTDSSPLDDSVVEESPQIPSLEGGNQHQETDAKTPNMNEDREQTDSADSGSPATEKSPQTLSATPPDSIGSHGEKLEEDSGATIPFESTVEPLSAGQAPPGPEATSFEPQPPAETSSTDVDSKVEPSTAARPDSEQAITPAALPLRCPLFPEDNDQPEYADSVEENTQMLVWQNRPGQSLAALVDGEIVNIYQSPYTGTTAYLRSVDGRFCIVYGHLEALEPGLIKGSRVTCGMPIAKSKSASVGPHVGIKVLSIAAGASWWQGQAVAPAEVLPELIPPEPEEVPEEDETP